MGKWVGSWNPPRHFAMPGWPLLSIAPFDVNLRAMTIDERDGCAGSGSPNFGVVILAAGASSRMRQPKLLLPWGGTTVLGHLLGQWKALHARQIAVVCAVEGEAVVAELDRLGFSG